MAITSLSTFRYALKIQEFVSIRHNASSWVFKCRAKWTIILPGVTISDNVIIEAGSLVNKDIPPDSLFVEYRKKNTNS